jgi:hypothetical protein
MRTIKEVYLKDSGGVLLKDEGTLFLYYFEEIYEKYKRK